MERYDPAREPMRAQCLRDRAVAEGGGDEHGVRRRPEECVGIDDGPTADGPGLAAGIAVDECVDLIDVEGPTLQQREELLAQTPGGGPSPQARTQLRGAQGGPTLLIGHVRREGGLSAGITETRICPAPGLGDDDQ